MPPHLTIRQWLHRPSWCEPISTDISVHDLAHVGVEVGGEGGAGHDDGDARHHRLARLGSGE